MLGLHYGQHCLGFHTDGLSLILVSLHKSVHMNEVYIWINKWINKSVSLLYRNTDWLFTLMPSMWKWWCHHKVFRLMLPKVIRHRMMIVLLQKKAFSPTVPVSSSPGKLHRSCGHSYYENIHLQQRMQNSHCSQRFHSHEEYPMPVAYLEHKHKEVSQHKCKMHWSVIIHFWILTYDTHFNSTLTRVRWVCIVSPYILHSSSIV